MAAEARYDMTVHPTSALVRSQSDGATAHQVTFPSCDCADFINRRGQLIEIDAGIAVTLCKHIAEGLRRVGGWNRPADPGPEVLGGLTHEGASGHLAEAGVNVREASRALNEAMRNSRSHAGRPTGLASVPVAYADGLFSVTIPR